MFLATGRGLHEKYTANVYRDLQGLCREIGVQGFQIYGDCMFTRNPCNIEMSSYFHVKIVGILTLQGYYGDTQSYIYQVL